MEGARHILQLNRHASLLQRPGVGCPLVVEAVKFLHLYVSRGRLEKSQASMGEAYCGIPWYPSRKYSSHILRFRPAFHMGLSVYFRMESVSIRQSVTG